MSGRLPFQPFTSLLQLHVAALWGLGITKILVSIPVIDALASGLLISFIILSLPRTGWSVRLLCLAMAVAMGVLVHQYDVGGAILDGIARASIFAAFLATIVLLRATADNRPETDTARQAFSNLPAEGRGGGIIVGAHIIGAILQVGVFAILAPIVGRDTPSAERRQIFLVAARGMALVPFWSPFIVAMALATEYLPAVPIWQIIILGMFLTILGVLVSVLVVDRARSLSGVWAALASLRSVMPGVFIAATIVIGTNNLTGWSTLQSLVIALPLPCLLAVLIARKGRFTATLSATRNGVGRIGPETTMLSFAITLGTVFEAAMPASGFLDWLRSLPLTPAMIIFLIITGMNITGLMGIHPIVPGTVLLVIFVNVPTGVADVILIQALLVGWGLCTLISMGSLMIATGSAMFDLSPTRLITPANIAYSFGLGFLCAGLLAVLNVFLVS